ncbi:hypothetical protein JCM10449v2_006016 [Rhodotorula kratochvilovae]
MPAPAGRKAPKSPKLAGYEERLFDITTYRNAVARVYEARGVTPPSYSMTPEESASAAGTSKNAAAKKRDKVGNAPYVPPTSFSMPASASSRRTRSASISEDEQHAPKQDESEEEAEDESSGRQEELLDVLDAPHDVRALISPGFAVELFEKESWVEGATVEESMCWLSTKSAQRPTLNLRNTGLSATRIRPAYHHLLVQPGDTFSDITDAVKDRYDVMSSPAPKVAAIARITIAGDAEMQQFADGGEFVEASHLCGEAKCVRPMHIVFEPAGVNRGRDECHAGLRACTHTIRCLTRFERKTITRAGGSPKKAKVSSSAKRGRAVDEEPTPKAKKAKKAMQVKKAKKAQQHETTPTPKAKARATTGDESAAPAKASGTIETLDITGASDDDEPEIRSSFSPSSSANSASLLFTGAAHRRSSRTLSPVPSSEASSCGGPDTPREESAAPAKSPFFGREPSPSLYGGTYVPVASGSGSWPAAVPDVRVTNGDDDDTQIVEDSQEPVDVAVVAAFKAREVEARVEAGVEVTRAAQVAAAPVEVEAVKVNVQVVIAEASSAGEAVRAEAEAKATDEVAEAEAGREEPVAGGMAGETGEAAAATGWWSWLTSRMR